MHMHMRARARARVWVCVLVDETGPDFKTVVSSATFPILFPMLSRLFFILSFASFLCFVVVVVFISVVLCILAYQGYLSWRVKMELKRNIFVRDIIELERKRRKGKEGYPSTFSDTQREKKARRKLFLIFSFAKNLICLNRSKCFSLKSVHYNS